MNGDQPSTPFGDDYDDDRSPEALLRERALVSRQVADLIAHRAPDFLIR